MSPFDPISAKLIAIGIAMSATRRREDLLDLIVNEARQLAL
jgi:hypothetical protein